MVFRFLTNKYRNHVINTYYSYKSFHVKLSNFYLILTFPISQFMSLYNVICSLTIPLHKVMKAALLSKAVWLVHKEMLLDRLVIWNNVFPLWNIIKIHFLKEIKCLVFLLSVQEIHQTGLASEFTENIQFKAHLLLFLCGPFKD